MNIYETKTMGARIAGNSYVGRGIVLGATPDGRQAVAAYFIMGRSANSRNRVFTRRDGCVFTEPFDASKVEDPSLIIYAAVRELPGKLIVTNGDQTDTIRDFMAEGKCYRHALMTREFEPDAPNYTPRISGVVLPDGSYKLSILKSFNGDPDCCCRYFYEYDKPVAGYGHFIHTYMGDGNPLPSFAGEPVEVSMPQAEQVWAALNADNKVSLYANVGGKVTLFNKNLGD